MATDQERERWAAVMERLVTDEMLLDITRLRAGSPLDLPLEILRQRLRYRDYDYEQLKYDVVGAVVDRYDEVDHLILRRIYRVQWPDGSKLDGRFEQSLDPATEAILRS